MPRRVHSSALLIAVALGVFAVARAALAAANDGAALMLHHKAIYTDYLATDFAAAEKGLTKALALCAKPTDCESATRARLHCDLGAILVSDSKKDEATAQFTAALKEDPKVTIGKDVTSPDAEEVFAAAKAGGGAAAGGAGAGGEEGKGGDAAPPAKGGGEAGGGKAAPVEGEMKHTPPPESLTNTPVPLFVELPESAGAVKAYVRYKPFGGDWKTAPLRKMGDGWGGEIPCADVGDSTGDLKYFVQAANGDGDVIASAGRISAPNVVKIVAQLVGEAPHLPDKDPPSRCDAASTDCPPNFPGCHSKEEKTSCQSNEDCEAGQTCSDGFCTSPESGEAEVPPKRNWISLSVQQDILLLPGKADGVCAGGSGYTCFSGNTYYAGIPVEGAQDDSVNGGVGVATTRFLLGYDRLVGQNLTLGARFGYVIGGGPQRNGGTAFLPVHIEARVAYWFGHNPFGRKGLRFYLVASGGAAEVDSSLQTYAITASDPQMTENTYTAWHKTGQGFASVGAGGMYAFTPGMGVTLELKGMELFPTTGTAFSAALGYAIGF